jgi:lysophospholipase L1-like esterase
VLVWYHVVLRVVLCCAVLCWQVDVLNRGLAGYSSQWALQTFDKLLRELAGRQVVLLTIWLGANDAAMPGRSA